MKNKNNKKNNKKFRLGLFIKISVALMLLISMTISFSSGTAVAEFVKTFSANIDFEGIPSPPWSYYLKDNSNSSGKTGTYTAFKSISQNIVIGTTVASDALVYEIKMPVKGTGLYTVDFTVDFTGPSGWSGYLYATGLGTLNNPVGCKINTKSADFTKSSARLITDAATKRAYNEQPVYGPDPYAKHSVTNASGTSISTINYSNYHDYQWKTLAPKNSENVSLTFYVADASKAAIWSWDLRGLGNGTYNSTAIVNGTYTINLTNISIKKIDAPDANEPYIDFADTHYVNNALHPKDGSSYGTGTTNLFSVKSGPNGTITGKAEGGKTRTNVARGTYLTKATYNSMTMQAEKLVFGYDNGTDMVTSESMGNERYSNLVSFGIPIKNVKAGKSYKITYDVGFARQGSSDVENQRNETYDYTKYSNYGNIFPSSDDELHMESYLYRGIKNGTKIDGSAAAATKTDKGLSQVYSIPGVTDTYFGRGNFFDPKKAIFNSGATKAADLGNANKGQAVTRYNELWRVGAGTQADPYFAITNNVNNLENIGASYLHNQTNNKYNWYNAIYSAETNGENTINWITFTNNTFTFTISTTDYYEGNIGQLRWVWALDGLEEKSWYRIKFDNVRIEEVVTYGSNVENNGITFNGTNAGYQTYEDIGLFRGANGTGQNYQPRVSINLPLANSNIYAPIYNAKGKTVKTSAGDQRIGLKGYAVCDGGVEKYVWSADGGDTWYDMETQYLSNITSDSALNIAEAHAENSTIGLKTANGNDSNGNENKSGSYICEYANFTVASGDGINAVYDIVANLKGTPYAGKTGLNIIFAAVPAANPNARCELIRITNYNS